MALPISIAADKVIKLLSLNKCDLTESAKIHLRRTGFITINNHRCRIINVRNNKFTLFGIHVNVSWFKKDQNDVSRLSINKNGIQEYSYTLIPTSTELFVIHYKALRTYCLKLENDQHRWFHEPNWGMKLDPTIGKFKWAGGNTIEFELERFSKSPLYNKKKFTENENSLNTDMTKVQKKLKEVVQKLDDLSITINSNIKLNHEKYYSKISSDLVKIHEKLTKLYDSILYFYVILIVGVLLMLYNFYKK